MSIINQNSLSFCESPFQLPEELRLFSKAVCRLPLALGRHQLFAKPPLPAIALAAELFERPPMPALKRAQG